MNDPDPNNPVPSPDNPNPEPARPPARPETPPGEPPGVPPPPPDPIPEPDKAPIEIPPGTPPEIPPQPHFPGPTAWDGEELSGATIHESGASRSTGSQSPIMAGTDPAEFRPRHLEDPRARDAVQLAAERFGWSNAKLPPDRGRGFAPLRPAVHAPAREARHRRLTVRIEA